jgi:hypothetical protein
MRTLAAAGGLALVAGLSTALTSTTRRSPVRAAATIVGSWQLVSAKANGKVIDVPAGTTILKHVTPTDFIFVYYDERGLITVAGGGPYKLSGNRYEETVKYGRGEGVGPLIGKTQVFSLRIDGDRWYHGGRESDGTVIEEVWERVRHD